MTSQEFQSKCIDKTHVKKLDTQQVMDTQSKLFIKNSDYFLKGAKSILESETPYLTPILGFFAMENRVKALAIKKLGYEIENHKCCEIFLEHEIKDSNLLEIYTNAWSTRKDCNYQMDLKAQTNSEDMGEFVSKILEPFIKEIDKLIDEEDQ